jgi:hypothetical protein
MGNRTLKAGLFAALAAGASHECMGGTGIS